MADRVEFVGQLPGAEAVREELDRAERMTTKRGVPTWTISMDQMRVKITFYGYPDNDDGAGHFGTAVIARQLEWQRRSRYADEEGLPFAGSTGTFDDPITAAASSGNRLFPPGTLAREIVIDPRPDLEVDASPFIDPAPAFAER